MTGSDSVEIKLKLNFPTIVVIVLILHVCFLSIKGLKNYRQSIGQAGQENAKRAPIRITNIKNFPRIRTVGAKDSKVKDSTYLSKVDTGDKKITAVPHATVANQNPSSIVRRESRPNSLKNLSLKDLSAGKGAGAQEAKAQKAAEQKAASTSGINARPGSRPGAMQARPKALSAISLKGNQINEFQKSGGNSAGGVASANSMSGDPRASSIANSDILVNLEVPEGVNPDELNKYELMFYGFQRRTAINYVNAFYKNLDKFQRENPHLQFPMTGTKQVMTGRLTYDDKGNVKQIKMIRWSNEGKLQDFFVDVLKEMDTLHNPPQALWQRNGEFSIFFSFVVNG